MKKPPIETELYKGFFRSNYLIIANQYGLSIVFVDNKNAMNSVHSRVKRG